MRALSCANLLKNGIDADQANALVSILKEHPTLKSLCGNKGDETELDMSGKMNGAGDAIMLVPELINNGAMTSLNLASNYLGSRGAKIVAEAIKVTKCTPAISMAPFSCLSVFSNNCYCLLLSAGYGGIDQAGYQQQLHRGCRGGGAKAHLRGRRHRARQVSSHEMHQQQRYEPTTATRADNSGKSQQQQ
jgi:hypothetical protein